MSGTIPILSTSQTNQPSVGTSSQRIQQLETSKYNEIFKDAKKIESDEQQFDQPIDSQLMNDCITIFGIEWKNGSIKGIGAYHVPSGTKENEIVEFLDEFGEKSNNVSLYLIGGNDASTKKGDLISEIYSAIKSHFGDISCIKEKKLNLIQGTKYEYVSAGIDMSGNLYYCFEQ